MNTNTGPSSYFQRTYLMGCAMIFSLQILQRIWRTLLSCIVCSTYILTVSVHVAWQTNAKGEVHLTDHYKNMHFLLAFFLRAWGEVGVAGGVSI